MWVRLQARCLDEPAIPWAFEPSETLFAIAFEGCTGWRYDVQMDLPSHALAFAVEGLFQTDSVIDQDPDGIPTKVHLLPEGFGERTLIRFFELDSVLGVVSDWCEVNGLELTLTCKLGSAGKEYTCKISESGNQGLLWLVESGDPDQYYDDLALCGNACYVILDACLHGSRILARERVARPT
jgi:hypothetical protein